MELLVGKLFVSLLLITFFLSGTASGQDSQFSQFYANPLFLNPSLAGADECMRIMAGYRNQWPALDNSFTTYALGADRRIDALSGGVGLTLMSDNAAGLVNTLRAGLIYSYHLKISRQATLNAGIEVVAHQQRLDWDELIFADMINTSTGQVLPAGTAEVKPDNTSVLVPDFATGLMLGIGGKYYAGIAAHHLAQPDIDYYTSSGENPLYRKYTFHAGASFLLSESYYQNNRGSLYFSPNLMYQQQKSAKQLNLGFNFTYYPITAGIWYRHNFTNPDAFIAFVGVKQERFKVGYSYDYSLSKLMGEAGGAHEVSVSILLNCEGKRNRPGAIKCPEF